MSEHKVNKRHYETMFIIKPTLVEEEIKSKIEFFKEVITKNGGEIETCLDMGMRTLAYEIKKHYRGYYFVIYFRADSLLVTELVRLYRIHEEILRFIVIRYETKREQKSWQTLVDRANKKPEKQKTLKKDETHQKSTDSESIENTEPQDSKEHHTENKSLEQDHNL
ncbi:30S ribosomal protein S6 [Helicobacter sp. MIT 14-3879]|uniref:30S ribosomal protein S6 n=1 Tax=Helicobacter sp. MIT 14-3879 TaxID=2040649 RepID=UPI000E1E57CF|nr:30S ribosomal protein S6 [Helicobacter sp. MIT 14-3879]RDU61407.1 30S ribosomal protein S6 [Helicobacter sp. MIT 14-3879]